MGSWGATTDSLSVGSSACLRALCAARASRRSLPERPVVREHPPDDPRELVRDDHERVPVRVPLLASPGVAASEIGVPAIKRHRREVVCSSEIRRPSLADLGARPGELACLKARRIEPRERRILPRMTEVRDGVGLGVDRRDDRRAQSQARQGGVEFSDPARQLLVDGFDPRFDCLDEVERSPELLGHDALGHADADGVSRALDERTDLVRVHAPPAGAADDFGDLVLAFEDLRWREPDSSDKRPRGRKPGLAEESRVLGEEPVRERVRETLEVAGHVHEPELGDA